MTLKVSYCSHKAAKFATTNWHYTKSMPTPPVIKFGVWEYSKFVGVVLFSRGANKNLGKSYGLSVGKVCELTRVALTTHHYTVSQIISICLRMLKQKEDVELVYSYADKTQGHHGGIYQAGNWVYTGETPPSFKYIDADRDWETV